MFNQNLSCDKLTVLSSLESSHYNYCNAGTPMVTWKGSLYIPGWSSKAISLGRRCCAAIEDPLDNAI